MPEIDIKDTPELKSVLRNITEMSFTGVIWVAWIYLFLPIINIFLWIFGLKHFNLTIIEQVGFNEFFDLINKMGWIILIIFLVLRLWGYYNYFAFGKKNRRTHIFPVTVKQLAKQFRLSEDEINSLQNKKEIHWNYTIDNLNK
ncbi:MAG: poly-beta-1,6-N-acetyl-D-glucosamine biosynthesis protein PgaD [Candidatus Brocadiales bacterium]|nr:poly-beta-1,6-N-acetyl-D-glucosamine biosynthesis protein PgaD [Candidatus Brocadiales bacterium]